MTDTLELDIAVSRGDFRLTVTESIGLSGITAVFGASGSGKTTLLRVIAGLEAAARGTIRFRGNTWLDGAKSAAPEQRSLGMVFQDGRLFPHLDVRGNLMFPLRHGRRRGPIGFDDTVRALGLEALLTRQVASLSGGERQRVGVGRALLSNPALLLMDEPLSSLDRERKRELLPLIRSLPAQFDLPVLYVTHDMDELLYLADTMLLLDHGHITGRGGPRELLQSSETSIVEARVVQHTETLTLAELGEQMLRLPGTEATTGKILRLRIDPSDVILANCAPTGISIRNCLKCTVLAVELRGDNLVNVQLAVGDQILTARVTQDAIEELGIRVGQAAYALIKSVALNAF